MEQHKVKTMHIVVGSLNILYHNIGAAKWHNMQQVQNGGGYMCIG